MNKLYGILFGLVLISGSVTPSFAQTSDESYSFFELLRFMFYTGDVKIITNSNSILDFDKAVIVLTSSTTTTSPTDSKTKDQTKDKTKDKLDDFANSKVYTSSNTSITKTTLCHIPPGNPDKSHSITVSDSSISVHLAHGDYLGACDDSNKTIKSIDDKNQKGSDHKEKQKDKKESKIKK